MALTEKFLNSVRTEAVHCKLAGTCSGCAWIKRPYADQLTDKTQEIQNILGSLHCSITPRIHSAGAYAGRSRLDLTLETVDGTSRLGLYGTDRQGVVDMLSCPMATPELESWLRDFRLHPLPPVKKGSLRLRISPDGTRGLWIDFSNEDIKALLDEAQWLEKMASQSIVEVGQRNKRLIKKEGRWKLGDPEHFGWFETYLGEALKPQPIYLPLSGFTQTGFVGNKLLVQTALSMLKSTGATEVLELFCGSGNFTLAMASQGLKVTAVELDSFAVEGLSKALREAELEDRVDVKRKDLYRIPKEELQSEVWFVDPPRSGLKTVIDRLGELSEKPRHLIYVSCFIKSWAEDAARLSDLGYQLRSLEGVDQFPNTPHCEWVSLFSL